MYHESHVTILLINKTREKFKRYKRSREKKIRPLNNFVIFHIKTLAETKVMWLKANMFLIQITYPIPYYTLPNSINSDTRPPINVMGWLSSLQSYYMSQVRTIKMNNPLIEHALFSLMSLSDISRLIVSSELQKQDIK